MNKILIIIMMRCPPLLHKDDELKSRSQRRKVQVSSPCGLWGAETMYDVGHTIWLICPLGADGSMERCLFVIAADRIMSMKGTRQLFLFTIVYLRMLSSSHCIIWYRWCCMLLFLLLLPLLFRLCTHISLHLHLTGPCRTFLLPTGLSISSNWICTSMLSPWMPKN